MPNPQTDSRTLTRRRLFALGSAGVAGAAASAAGLSLTQQPAPEQPAARTTPGQVPFDGLHQAGVATAAQAHLLLTAYELAPGAGRTELATVLKAWTAAARELVAGRPAAPNPLLDGGTGPAALTITVGVGGSLLDTLALPRPAALVDLPNFPGDRLDPARSDGDVVVQICADDPMIIANADRVLRRAATGTLLGRWHDTGFQSAAARRDGTSTRNLMGQLDGTNNISTGQTTVSGPVWIDATDPGWMLGGTYMAVRRIRMLLDRWESVPVHRQEQVIGRHKASGAPLGSTQETDAVDLDARGPHGAPLIPVDSHVRLSTPGEGEKMRRRSYSYTAGPLPDGTADQGLLFVSFQKDPTTSFVPVQQRLAERDALNAFTLTTGSALFAVLPGTRDDQDWLGRALLS